MKICRHYSTCNEPCNHKEPHMEIDACYNTDYCLKFENGCGSCAECEVNINIIEDI